MQAKLMRYTIFVAAMAACLGVASAQQPLTNSSIVQMVKAGLGESVAVDAIHTQPISFPFLQAIWLH